MDFLKNFPRALVLIVTGLALLDTYLSTAYEVVDGKGNFLHLITCKSRSRGTIPSIVIANILC